jgi:hypothetical protein
MMAEAIRKPGGGHVARIHVTRSVFTSTGKVALLLLVMAALAGCFPLPAPSAPPPAAPTAVEVRAASGSSLAQGTETSAPTATPEDRWTTLFQRTPYPYTASLPPPSSSPLDGTYVKDDLSQAEHVHCLRCPDYLPEAGLWKLNLDRGVFRIYHEVTGWRSLGSFTTAGNEMRVFNDPNCPDLTGAYKWQLADGKLVFSIEDECSIQLRAAN